ncbi:MAG: hypothetical protein KAR44_09895, partial [Candidatus Aegiribacteria sp.]|nr:hypothetical protein [Candidatus Aegiribacteria sp.]
MKFWKLAWRRMIRGKSTSILTLLVLILGSALFVDSNISLSFTINRAFEDANESVFVDITVSLSLFDRISSTETQQLVDEIQSIRSIASAEPLALFSGIAFAPGDENSPYNVTITGISSETEYFSSALSLDWSSQSEGNKCYVSSSGSFLEYSETNRDLIVNFTLIGNDGPRIVSFDVDVESSVNLTLAQESITQGIFMSDADPRTRLEKNVIFIDYERIMEFAEIDEVPDRLVFGYDNSILISVDRSSFDILQIDLATSHMQTVGNSIANLVKATSQNSVVQNHLGLTLVTIASWIGIQSIEAQSLIVSVVFVSCYLAFVSYRITHRRRRREFGRLRTKGFPQEYISRTDITESAILGITGGL